MTKQAQKGVPSQEALDNALCELGKVCASMQALDARRKKLIANIVKHPKAPQKFVIEGLGTLNQSAKTSYAVDNDEVIKVIGKDGFIKIASVSMSHLKKNVTSAQFVKIEEAGAITKSVGKVSYSFKKTAKKDK